jgi:hypothetical protein
MNKLTCSRMADFYWRIQFYLLLQYYNITRLCLGDPFRTTLPDSKYILPTQNRNSYFLYTLSLHKRKTTLSKCVLVSGSVDSLDLQLFSSDPYPLWVGIILNMSTLGGDKLLYEIITTVFHEVQFNMIPKNLYGPRDCFLWKLFITKWPMYAV